MTIGYRDFLPAVVKRGFFSSEHETLDATVARANEWIASAKVRVLNVETVVLPKVESEEQASEVGVRTSGETSNHWYQFVRVWYEAAGPAA